MEMSDPFEEGKLAAAQDVDPITCPYAIDTTEYDKWRAGYDYVKGSDEDGEPLEDA